VLGAVLLALGLLAGSVNREVLDGARFAAHVDSVRKDPLVAERAGQAITVQLLDADPDLVAVRPLLESTATSLVGSPTFGPVVRLAARQVHQAMTNDDPTQIVLRLADLGVVLSGVLRAVAPAEAAKIPPDLNLTLAELGAQTPAADTLRLIRTVGLLSWLFPLLALVAFGVAVGVGTDRRRATVTVGRGILAAGLTVAWWPSRPGSPRRRPTPAACAARSWRRPCGRSAARCGGWPRSRRRPACCSPAPPPAGCPGWIWRPPGGRGPG
jgi:hypothetical protein